MVKLGGGRTSLAELHYWQVSGGFRNRRAVVKLPGGAVVNVRQSCVMLPESADDRLPHRGYARPDSRTAGRLRASVATSPPFLALRPTCPPTTSTSTPRLAANQTRRPF